MRCLGRPRYCRSDPPYPLDPGYGQRGPLRKHLRLEAHLHRSRHCLHHRVDLYSLLLRSSSWCPSRRRRRLRVPNKMDDSTYTRDFKTFLFLYSSPPPFLPPCPL
ncbi:hypothetical protein BKA57DRAFT_533596 [Linnemannia elongata]|nr:hypothetical protein BKA57DRAFT_533596 [Linnemannia elongata]